METYHKAGLPPSKKKKRSTDVFVRTPFHYTFFAIDFYIVLCYNR